MQRYWSSAITRFNAQGRQVQFESDYVVTAGPVWIAEEMLFEIVTISDFCCFSFVFSIEEVVIGYEFDENSKCCAQD